MMIRRGLGYWRLICVAVMVTAGCTITPTGGTNNRNGNGSGVVDSDNDNGDDGSNAGNDNQSVVENDNADVGDAGNDNGGPGDNDNDSGVNDNDNDNASPPVPPTALIDTDGDGFSDDAEINGVPGTDPFDPSDTPDNPRDSDGDGCSNFDESNFAGFCDGNPFTMGEPIDVDNPDATFTFSMTVARHMSVVFTDQQVDAVLGEASMILQNVDTECPDVATGTTFARTGPTTTFSIGSSMLTTETQLDAVFDVPQDIKIVQMMVGVCGIPAGGDFSVVLGCAFTGGSLVIVATADADVWAHEWGHVQGLDHRDDCPRNLMHSFEVQTNAVNASERAAFLRPTPNARQGTAGVVQSASDVSDGHLARGAEEPLSDWLARLADATYMAGVPSSALTDLGTDAAGPLTAMLDDPRLAERRYNVVRMLGFTHDAGACPRLMDDVEGAAGELSFSVLASLAECFLAVGRLAGDDPTDAALDWLTEGADPATWMGRGVGWRYGSVEGERAAEFLARMSVMGLSVSEHPAAGERLRALRASLAGTQNGIEVIGQLDEAIARMDGVSLGLRQSIR